jgi:hypothetical protein
MVGDILYISTMYFFCYCKYIMLSFFLTFLLIIDLWILLLFEPYVTCIFALSLLGTCPNICAPLRLRPLQQPPSCRPHARSSARPHPLPRICRYTACSTTSADTPATWQGRKIIIYVVNSH